MAQAEEPAFGVRILNGKPTVNRPDMLGRGSKAVLGRMRTQHLEPRPLKTLKQPLCRGGRALTSCLKLDSFSASARTMRGSTPETCAARMIASAMNDGTVTFGKASSACGWLILSQPPAMPTARASNAPAAIRVAVNRGEALHGHSQAVLW